MGDRFRLESAYKDKCWNITNATFNDGKLEWVGMRFAFRREGDEVKGKRYSYNQGITHSITLKR